MAREQEIENSDFKVCIKFLISAETTPQHHEVPSICSSRIRRLWVNAGQHLGEIMIAQLLGSGDVEGRRVLLTVTRGAIVDGSANPSVCMYGAGGNCENGGLCVHHVKTYSPFQNVKR